MAAKETALKPRYFAWTRQITGRPTRFYAYVMDRETGRPVVSCSHLHGPRERWEPNPAGMTRRTSGAVYAQRCADRMLAAWNRRASS